MASVYQEQQRSKALALIAQRAALFDGASGGRRFMGSPRDFVLHEVDKNLFDPLRASAQEYFAQNGISWWGGRQVTGHTLSSQVACVNHLFGWRHDADAALAVLQGLSPDFVKPLRLDSDKFGPAYVQFEAVSQHQYLNEDGLTRGSQCTSIDAMMYTERSDGSRWLVPIEWKFTEHYGNTNKAMEGVKADPVNGKGVVRQQRYTDLIRKSAQLQDVDLGVYYFEPFYQLMRQTLLAEQMVVNSHQEAIQADGYLHVHVIPAANQDLKGKVYRCSGLDMEATWRKQLSDQTKYRIVEPEALLAPLATFGTYSPLMAYLRERYWA